MSILRILLTSALAWQLMGAPAVAGPQSDSTAKQPGYLASYWHNGLALAKSPLHWKADQWVTAGASVTLTGIILGMDEPLSQPVFDWDNKSGNHFGKTGAIAGGVLGQLGISGGAYGAGLLTHNRSLQNFALDNLQAQVFTGGLTFITKELFHRSRPYNAQGAYQWKGPFKGSGDAYQSFFSGHSSLAFSTATMIFLHSKRRWWVGLASYGAASAIAASRIQQQKHWLSDVVMGAIVGSAVSAYVYRLQEQRRHPEPALKALP